MTNSSFRFLPAKGRPLLGVLFACVCVLFLSGRAPAETQAVSETDEVAEQSVSVTEEKEGILSSLFSFDSFFGEDEEASEEAALTELPEAPEVAEVPEETVATAEEELASEPSPWAENERYIAELLEDGGIALSGTVEKGDTAGEILQELTSASEAYAIVNAAEDVWSLRKIRVGQPFIFVKDGEGNFVSFTYEANKDEQLVVTREGEKLNASLVKISYDIELALVKGQIDSSLFDCVAGQGEEPLLAIQLASVFECEINFINDIREQDSFEVLVEKRYRKGEFKGYGHIVAAWFTNRGKRYEAYLYANADGALHHYNAQGEALQMALLKAPLAFTRVSSKFNLRRRHPILGVVRPHEGIDYAAPKGTPVRSVGDGVVTRAGWGKGYGNMIVVKHRNGLETQYAHLSAFAKNLKKGVEVEQGDVIGYVGATGLATGPHLDFRMRKDGKYVNPDDIIVPREDPVEKSRMNDFLHQVALSKAFLEGETELAEYTTPEWAR